MSDLEKQQSVEDAISTLEASKGNSQEQTDYAARMAQTYAQNQAAFNANGNPDEQNVSTNVDPKELEDHDNNVEFVEAEPCQDESELLRQELSQLQGEVEVLKQTVASEHDKMVRAVAEADNVRKRAAQDVERERKFALEKFVKSLMPVYDALEKALEFSDRNNEATKATIDGVDNTLTLFLKELSSFGVERIDPTGQPFDPNFHQAISMVPSTEVPNNHVLSTMQKGFTLNGRVVRPAMVIVAKV